MRCNSLVEPASVSIGTEIETETEFGIQIETETEREIEFETEVEIWIEIEIETVQWKLWPVKWKNRLCNENYRHTTFWARKHSLIHKEER